MSDSTGQNRPVFFDMENKQVESLLGEKKLCLSGLIDNSPDIPDFKSHEKCHHVILAKSL